MDGRIHSSGEHGFTDDDGGGDDGDGSGSDDNDRMVIETTATTTTTTTTTSSSSSKAHIVHTVEGGDHKAGGDVRDNNVEGAISMEGDISMGVDISAGGSSTMFVTEVEVEIEEMNKIESVVIVTSSSSTIADTPTHTAVPHDTSSHDTPSSLGQQSDLGLGLELEAGGGGGEAGGGLSFSGVLAAGTRLEEELARLKVE